MSVPSASSLLEAGKCCFMRKDGLRETLVFQKSKPSLCEWLEAPVFSTGMPQRAIQQGLMPAGLGNPLCFPFLLCYLLETSDTMEMSHRLYFTREVRVVTGEQRKYLTMTLLHIDFIDFHFLHPYIRDRKSSHEDWKHILPFLTSLTYRGYLYPRNISNGFLNHAMSFMTIIKDPF